MCAFIQYVNRHPAEKAAESTFNKLILGGRRLNIKWGKSQGRQGVPGEPSYEPVPGLPGPLPPPPIELRDNFFNLSTGGPGPSAGQPPGGEIPPQPILPPPPMFMPVRPPAAAAAVLRPLAPPPPFFFPPQMRMAMFPPQPPPLCPPGTAPPLPPESALAPPGTSSAPPVTIPAVHYPSQDPRRLGASEKGAPTTSA